MCANAGPREEYWVGLDIAAGEPFPVLPGAMLGFNLHEEFRLSVGAGFLEEWNTYQLDVKLFLSPEALAAYIGGGISHMRGGPSKALFWLLEYDKITFPYLEGGMDYTTEIGLHININAGLAGVGPFFIFLPGIALGWYF